MQSGAFDSQLELLLLAALAEGPRHGYSIIEALRERSAGQVDLQTGTVYPALRRLERTGLIRGAWSAVSGRRRRTYTLTAAGRHVLEQRRSRWYAIVAAVDAVLGTKPA